MSFGRYRWGLKRFDHDVPKAHVGEVSDEKHASAWDISWLGIDQLPVCRLGQALDSEIAVDDAPSPVYDLRDIADLDCRRPMHLLTEWPNR